MTAICRSHTGAISIYNAVNYNGVLNIINPGGCISRFLYNHPSYPDLGIPSVSADIRTAVQLLGGCKGRRRLCHAFHPRLLLLKPYRLPSGAGHQASDIAIGLLLWSQITTKVLHY